MYELMWNLIDEHGIDSSIRPTLDSNGVATNGQFLFMQLVKDGMALQPCSPTFVSARDAVLDADVALTKGKNQCLIWKAFAKRGIGSSAASSHTAQGKLQVRESFDLPDDVC